MDKKKPGLVLILIGIVALVISLSIYFDAVSVMGTASDCSPSSMGFLEQAEIGSFRSEHAEDYCATITSSIYFFIIEAIIILVGVVLVLKK